MIDGTYQVEIDAPLGRKTGLVVIRTDGSAAIADIDAPFIGKQRIEGRADGDSFTAEGTFKLKLVGKVSYALDGQVIGDELHISIDSSKGSFELTGARI